MKIIKKITVLLLVLLLAFVVNSTVVIKYYNANALYGSATKKLQRAEAIQQQKYIVVGGSASNLAFDSELFEELSGKPAVNLAISAAVPLGIYMKAAENCANAGDVIIMPLEYTFYWKDPYGVDEAYVDMLAVDPSLKCVKTFQGNMEYYYTSFLRSFSRLNDCFLFAVKSGLETENTIYIADSVNEYGDFCLHENRTPTYSRVVQDTTFVYAEETMQEIRAFIERMGQKGVTVYISYPSYDLYSVKGYEQYAQKVQETVGKYIPSDHIIGTPLDFAYDEDFFFDTPYHIQYENRAQYTQDLFACYQQTVAD